MKTLSIALFLSLTAITTVHAINPCYDAPKWDQADCFRRYQEQQDETREMQRKTDAFSNWANTTSQQEQATAQQSDQQIQQQKQLQQILDQLNPK